MAISRRGLLKRAVVAGATTALAGDAFGRERVEPGAEAVGMLFDSTRCVGCRACQTACKVANQLPPDRASANGGQYDAPDDLNSSTKNVIKAYDAGGHLAFVKQQCMHCVDPSCVSACMLGAMHKAGDGKRRFEGEKKGSGIVAWDKYTCTGCRYCQLACAFNVPKFEWFEAFPRIVKCELCRHRADPGKEGPLAVANPACAEVCPRDAVVYGWRRDLLDEARRRIAAEPARYLAHVYGELEGGGTQVLYLTSPDAPFVKLGLPELPARSAAEFSETVSHAPYLHGLTPVALYAGVAWLVRRNQRKEEAERGQEDT